MPEIAIGLENIAELLVGEMGIKDAIVGEETVYTRPGGYFYLILDTTESE